MGNSDNHDRRRRSRGLLIVAVVAILGAGVAIVVGLSAQHPEVPVLSTQEQGSESVPTPQGSDRPDGPAGTTSGSTESRSARSDKTRGTVLDHSEPVRVRIPRLDVNADLQSLTINENGSMQVPSEPAAAGWYTGGPAPGSLGPAVLTGHVTWNQDPAVFFDLATLQKGDRIEVSREDGSVAVFSVTRSGQYEKDEFPSEKVYGAVDYAALRLVTCGGEYDDERNRYADNVVVYAELTGSR